MEASLYEELWRTEQQHWWFVARRRILRALVDRYGPNGSSRRLRICELGCGTGGNLAAWADQHDVLGLDASQSALAYARLRLGQRARYGKLPDDVPLQREWFDVVLAPDVLEHVKEDVQSARTALSLLRPGGILVATVPAYQWLYSPRDERHRHWRRYGKRQFARLFRLSGIKLELLRFYNTWLFPVAAAVRLCSKLGAPDAGPGDLRPPPRPINRLLTELFASERFLLGRVRLPFGLSLIAVARKLPAPQAESVDVPRPRRAA